MLAGPYEDLSPGTLVEAINRDGRYVGRGFYNSHSEITLRLLTEDPNVFPNERWFRQKISEAIGFRDQTLNLKEKTNAYRIIHSEGDGLSGLVVDRFAQFMVLELFSAGMHRHLEWVRKALLEHFPESEFVVRADRRSERHEGLNMDGPPPSQKANSLVIKEGRAKFHVDLRSEHKTGFFLDQRENRARVADLCRGEDLFDGFCYTGGFAISAALAGARTVEAVDLDEQAIGAAQRNERLNGLDKSKSKVVHFIHGNVFNVLRAHRVARRKFSRIVLDPAKLAITKQEIPKAMTAYADMNRLAMDCLKPGGLLVSCSCTGLVDEEDFLMALRAAAAETNVEQQIFHIAGAAPDHPFVVRVPEGRYLKVVYSRVSPHT